MVFDADGLFHSTAVFFATSRKFAFGMGPMMCKALKVKNVQFSGSLLEVVKNSIIFIAV